MGDNSFADLVRQSAYLSGGGKPQGGRDIDKVNDILGTVRGSSDFMMNTIKQVLANKKAQLDNKGLEQDQTPLSETVGSPFSQLPQEVKNYGNVPTGKFANLAGGQAVLQKATSPQLMNDDERPASNVYRPDYMKSIFPNVSDEERANIKVGQVKAAITTNNQSTLDKDRDENRKNLEEDRSQRAYDRNISMRTALVGRYNSLANVKKYQTSMDGADDVIALLDSSNPLADGSIPTYLTKSSGEVGALSESDKAPFGGSKALKARLAQAISDMKSGKLTPENRAFAKQLAETMKKSAIRNMNNASKKFAKQEARVGGYGTEEDVLYMVNPDYEAEAAPGQDPNDPLGILK